MRPRLASLLITVLCLTIAPTATADTITIAPGQSIQAAINLLLINSSPIDTVLLSPGTYAQSAVVDFSGTNQTGMTIARKQSSRPIILGGILVRDAFRVTLSGLRVDSPHGDQTAAIVVRDSSAIAVDKCSGFPGDDGGLDVEDTFEMVVLQSDFSGMEVTSGEGGYGLKIIGGCAHFLSNVEAAANEREGIFIQADESELRDVVATGGEAGGMLIDGLRNVLKSCTAKSNGGVGIAIEGVADLKSCTVAANDGVGVRFGEDGGSTEHGGVLKGSTIKNNGGNGVLVREEHRGLIVKGNKLTANKGAGVRLIGDGNHVTDNSIKETKSGSNGGHGVLIESASRRNCIDQNTVKENAGTGVRVEGDDNYVLANVGKSGDGFVDAGGSGNSGRANTTSGNNDFP